MPRLYRVFRKLHDAEYNALRVDCIVLYPSKFVASSGREYDELFEALRNEGLPWTADLDINGHRLVETNVLDHEFATLRFPIFEYARRIEERRRAARARDGLGGGEELGWKLQVNTMYGVLASPHHVTNNVVAANYITAQGRACMGLVHVAQRLAGAYRRLFVPPRPRSRMHIP